jgi:hypothetical protein
MVTTRKSTTALPEISFQIEDFSSKLLKNTYYYLRDKISFQIKRQLGEQFNWDEYLLEFENNFGTPDVIKLSLEQLLYFAKQKFGATEETIVQYSRDTYKRRQARVEAQVC